MKPLGAWVSVLALFVCGVLLGGVAVHLLYDTGRLHPGPDRPRLGRHADRPSLPVRWLDRLDLTEEQRREIERIRAESHAEAQRLRDAWEPELRRHLAETRARIDAVLTEGQREEFRKLRERQHHRAERYFLGERHGRRPAPRD